MNLPDKKREAVVAAVAQEVTEHAAHMETYTLPALQPGFIDGWMHAMRLLTRDAGFIGSKSADALAPLLAGWLAKEGARVREQMREEIARAAHGLPANNLARAALALADEENVALLDRLEAAEAKVARVEAVADECDRRTAREPDRVLTFWVRRLRAALDADAAETTGGGA